MSPFVAAVVQDAPVVFDSTATLEKVRGLTAEAAGAGAKLVVFPEAFVSAYPKGLDFGARVGMRSPKGRDDFMDQSSRTNIAHNRDEVSFRGIKGTEGLRILL